MHHKSSKLSLFCLLIGPKNDKFAMKFLLLFEQLSSDLRPADENRPAALSPVTPREPQRGHCTHADNAPGSLSTLEGAAVSDGSPTDSIPDPGSPLAVQSPLRIHRPNCPWRPSLSVSSPPYKMS